MSNVYEYRPVKSWPEWDRLGWQPGPAGLAHAIAFDARDLERRGHPGIGEKFETQVAADAEKEDVVAGGKSCWGAYSAEAVDWWVHPWDSW